MLVAEMIFTQFWMVSKLFPGKPKGMATMITQQGDNPEIFVPDTLHICLTLLRKVKRASLRKCAPSPPPQKKGNVAHDLRTGTGNPVCYRSLVNINYLDLSKSTYWVTLLGKLFNVHMNIIKIIYLGQGDGTVHKYTCCQAWYIDWHL